LQAIFYTYKKVVGQIKTDGKVIISTKLDNSGLKKDIAQLPSSMKGIKSSLIKIAGLLASAFSVTAIVNFGKKAIELGSDLAEVQNVVDVTFGSMSSTVNKFAKDAMKSYGLSEKVAKQYMGTFGAMSKAFGYTTSAAYEQATALTGLTGDVASFYNLSTDEAFTKLKSVYTGETESLKDLGIVMTQTALDEFALQKGMGKTTKSMSEQEKVALRLAFVTERLSGASGDFLRTSDGWANQTRVLSLQFESLQATIGQGLINILTPGLRLLNELIAKLQIVADKFKELTEVFFGHSEGTASGMGAVAQSTGEISDNFNSATESAKELNKQLAGFDKLNVLGSSESGSVSSSAPSGATELDSGFESFEETDTTIDKIKLKLDELKEKLLGIAEVGGFMELWDKFLAGVNDAKIGTINLFESLKAGTIANIPNFKALASSLQDTFFDISQAWTTIYGDMFVILTKNFREWTEENKTDIALFFANVIENVTNATTLITDIVGDMYSDLGAWWEANGKTVFDKFIKSINDVRTWIINIYNTVIAPIVEKITSKTRDLWNSSLRPHFQNILGLLSDLGEMIMAFWNNILKPVVDWIVKYLGPPIKAVFGTLVDIIWRDLSSITDSINGIITALRGVIQFLTGVFSGDWEKAWGGIKMFFTGIWESIKNGLAPVINGIIDAVEFLVNSVINGINWMIRKLNSLGNIKLPEIIGGGSIGFNIKELSTVSIPRLAQGAVIPANKEFLAVLGDQKNGRNLELPESLLRQIVREESGNGKNGGTFIIQLMLKGKVIGEEAVEYVNGVIRKTGKSPIKQGG